MTLFGGGSAGWLWALAALALVVGAILLVVWAVQRAGGGPEDEPSEILRVRFARGEIDATQYEELRRVLTPTPRRPVPDRIGLIGLLLVLAAVVAWLAGAAVGPAGSTWGWGGWPMMGPGMMSGTVGIDQAMPGSPGFAAGTQAAPRVVHIVAGPGYTFSPAEVAIVAGETITFEVTAVGPYAHEFKVGPAAGVAADSEAAPEIANIGMMQTKALTYTFSGTGPFAFACHAPGHYEAGMRGVVTIVSG